MTDRDTELVMLRERADERGDRVTTDDLIAAVRETLRRVRQGLPNQPFFTRDGEAESRLTLHYEGWLADLCDRLERAERHNTRMRARLDEIATEREPMLFTEMDVHIARANLAAEVERRLAAEARVRELEDELVMLRERAEMGERQAARRLELLRQATEEVERLRRQWENRGEGCCADVAGTAYGQGQGDGAAAERKRIVAHAAETANGIVIDGTHSVDYWTGFRDALECFARNVADGAHLDGTSGGDRE